MTIPITGHTKLIGLLGDPVAHSISPMMHNESFRLLGLDYVYLCFRVNEDTLPHVVTGLRDAGIRGFNVTMPCKNQAAQLCDRLSPAARLIGAVNTVVCDDGVLTGHNTDGVGFWRAAALEGFSVPGKRITLMGMGGASTAIAVQAALDQAAALDIFVRPTSRFFPRARRVADELNHATGCRVRVLEHEDQQSLADSIGQADLLVNGTSVGMAPNTDATILTDCSLLRPDLMVADVIYNPRETLFLKNARQAGCRTFNGMYMLLYQGAEAFRLWTGQDMPVELIREKYFSQF